MNEADTQSEVAASRRIAIVGALQTAGGVLSTTLALAFGPPPAWSDFGPTCIIGGAIISLYGLQTWRSALKRRRRAADLENRPSPEGTR